MKIGILTHTLSTNYGGLLQNFALQTILRELGHKPVTLNHQEEIPLKTKILSVASRIIRTIKGEKVPLRVWPTKKERNVMAQNVAPFACQYINTTQEFKMHYIYQHTPKDLDAIIVGSDQVWNARYLKPIEQFFLSDFQNMCIKRIAYAASFGMNTWQYTDSETVNCSKLAKQFNAISVRETSGISYCKDYLGVDAELVLDPTLLISSDYYVNLVEKANLDPLSSKTMMVYILDKTPDKAAIIKYVSSELGLIAHSVMAEKKFKDVGRSQLHQCIFPSVELWLQGLMESEFVVTDSFHGTVFCIIFNKPFIAILNKSRGSDRFTSLLNMLNLSNRLVTTIEEASKALQSDISFTEINQRLQVQRVKSINFLKSCLS